MPSSYHGILICKRKSVILNSKSAHCPDAYHQAQNNGEKLKEQLEKDERNFTTNLTLDQLMGNYQDLVDIIIDDASANSQDAFNRLDILEKNFKDHAGLVEQLFSIPTNQELTMISAFAISLLDHSMLMNLGLILIEQNILPNKIIIKENTQEGTKKPQQENYILLANRIINNVNYSQDQKRIMLDAIARHNPDCLEVKDCKGVEGKDLLQGEEGKDLLQVLKDNRLESFKLIFINNGFTIENATLAEELMCMGVKNNLEATEEELLAERYDHDKRDSDNYTLLAHVIKSGNFMLYDTVMGDLKQQDYTEQQIASYIWGKQLVGERFDHLPEYNCWDLALEANSAAILEDLWRNWGEYQAQPELYNNTVKEILAKPESKLQQNIAKYYELVNWPISITEAIEGIDINNKFNERGNSLLYELVKLPEYIFVENNLDLDNNKFAVIKKLVEELEADPLTTQRANGWGAFHLAIKSEQFQIAEIFSQIKIVELFPQNFTSQLTREQVNSLQNLIEKYELQKQQEILPEFKRSLEELLCKYKELEFKVEECEILGQDFAY